MKCDLEITHNCNNNCIHCQKNTKGKKGEFTEFAQIQDILTKRAKNSSSIIIGGGEPTIHPEFKRIVKYSCGFGVEVSLLTNGRKLSDKKLAKSICESGIKDINIPLHSASKKIHEQTTRVKGSFQETIRALKNLFELKSDGYPIRIIPKFLISKLNAKGFPGLMRFVAKEFPASDLIIIQPLNMKGEARRNKDKLLITLTEAQPYITESLKIGFSSSLNICLRTIPACIFPKPEDYYDIIPPLDEQPQYVYQPDNMYKGTADETMSKSELCAQCERDSFCKGVWSSYGKMAGLDELKPIKSLKIPAWLKTKNIL